MHAAPDVRNERGIALALAVVTLVIVGAIVAGAVFVGRLEQQGGENTIYAGQALAAADGGLAAMVARWSSAHNRLADGDSLELPQVELEPGAHVFWRGELTRASRATFIARATGSSEDGAGNLRAERSLALLLRLRPLRLPLRSALRARDGVALTGNAAISGLDVPPPGWAASTGARDACPPASDSVPSAVDSLEPADSTALFAAIQALIGRADVVVSGATISPSPSAASECLAGNESHWGEPASAVPECGRYFPIVYRDGDLTLGNGRGQGVLVVIGHLHIAGNLTFAGVIIVHGKLEVGGSGNHLFGAVFADSARVDDPSSTGAPVIQFSRCAVSAALLASALPEPFVSRAWGP